jgi:hypothetical protein
MLLSASTVTLTPLDRVASTLQLTVGGKRRQHASSHPPNGYDHRRDEVSLDEVEWIVI